MSLPAFGHKASPKSLPGSPGTVVLLRWGARRATPSAEQSIRCMVLTQLHRLAKKARKVHVCI